MSDKLRVGGLADARGATNAFFGVTCSCSSLGWNSDSSRRSAVTLVMLLECDRASSVDPRDTVERREVVFDSVFALSAIRRI